ncbi:murein L,D-transpeptidase catalytic domain-containing protein [Sphingobacterium ginsenosidimutans]|uniref:Peptidoglycan binding-like domain-containing protein n=1 Tax=Sphingobacterium ginsenosidimutans TaxID=687845 RepID=A0ABP7ZW01_9SPHI
MKTISIIPSFGDKGQHVEAVQIKLTELGYSLGNIDGAYGNQTKNAIRSFRDAHNLDGNGQLDAAVLKLLGLTVEKELSDDPFVAIPSLVDRTGISKTRWENGNRGQAPYGFYYGMGLLYANLYEGLKKGDRVALDISKPLGDKRDKDALLRFKELISKETANELGTAEDRLRGLFVMLFGLGLMESNGKHCCGWDRGKLTGRGDPTKIKVPTAENSEAGLFQTSYDILEAVSASGRKLMLEIFGKYQLSQDGTIALFAKGAHCSLQDAENYGEGEGKVFQYLSKTSPAFSVEFTAVGLRSAARHWNPIRNVGDHEDGLQIKKECDDLLKDIQAYVDQYLDAEPQNMWALPTLGTTQSDPLKQQALALAKEIGQKHQLQELFDFDPKSKANYWAIVDYNKPRTEKRLFIFDLQNKEVKSYMVSHAKNSGDLYATEFSNEIGSNKSCLGIFKTGKTYISDKNGRSLYLDGLQETNSHTRERYIVLHPGEYVTDKNAGRSLGCFVVSPVYVREVIDHLQGGSYLLAWRS